MDIKNTEEADEKAVLVPPCKIIEWTDKTAAALNKTKINEILCNICKVKFTKLIGNIEMDTCL